MAIVSVTQIGAGRRGGGSLDSRSYNVVFQVLVSSPYDGIATVGNAPGIPGRFMPYAGYENTNDPQALCTKVDPEQDGDDWQKWRVTCTFDTNWNQNQQPQNDDPEDDPPIFWIETEFVTKATTKEWDGTPIVNKAGQLIEGLERFDSIETWVWERNYTSLNRGVWKTYQNSVNSADFDEIDAKHGLLHIIVPKPTFRNGVKYWRVQFRVKVSTDEDGWQVNPANRGTAVKNASGKLERPVDDKGKPFDGEVPLKNDGTQERNPAAVPLYIGKKDLYRPRDFNALGFA